MPVPDKSTCRDCEEPPTPPSAVVQVSPVAATQLVLAQIVPDIMIVGE